MAAGNTSEQISVCRVSEFLGISGSELERLGAYDGFLGTDSRLFLDPFLFEGMTEPIFLEARKKVRNYFSTVIKLLRVAKEGDRFWKKAVKLLTFKENAGLGLGYGKGTTNGSAIGPKLAKTLARSAQELMSMGIDDPEIFELVGLFTEKFGPDRLSDMTARILSSEIITYTASIIETIGGIKDGLRFKDIDGRKIPLGPNGKLIFLLPRAALRDLPVAQSFEEIGEASTFNEDLRDRYNSLIGGLLATPKSERKKDKIKEYLFADRERLRVIAESYAHVDPQTARYDFKSDPAGENYYYEAGVQIAESFPVKTYNHDATSLRQAVQDVVSHFKRVVEAIGGWELLHGDDGKPRRERSAQQLFLITAQKICEAHDIRVVREAADGRGAVDFLFCRGFHGAIVVELKLSSNRDLFHGFETQLPIYADVERCIYAEFVVVKVNTSSKQLARIDDLIREKEKNHEWVPGLTIVDALPKPTPSVA